MTNMYLKTALMGLVAVGLCACNRGGEGTAYMSAPRPAVWADSNGCQYLIVDQGYGVAMTPRLSADNKVMCGAKP